MNFEPNEQIRCSNIRKSFHDVRLVIKNKESCRCESAAFYLNEAKASLLNGTAPRGCFIPVNLLTS